MPLLRHGFLSLIVTLHLIKISCLFTLRTKNRFSDGGALEKQHREKLLLFLSFPLCTLWNVGFHQTTAKATDTKWTIREKAFMQTNKFVFFKRPQRVLINSNCTFPYHHHKMFIVLHCCVFYESSGRETRRYMVLMNMYCCLLCFNVWQVDGKERVFVDLHILFFFASLSVV